MRAVYVQLQYNSLLWYVMVVEHKIIASVFGIQVFGQTREH